MSKYKPMTEEEFRKRFEGLDNTYPASPKIKSPISQEEFSNRYGHIGKGDKPWGGSTYEGIDFNSLDKDILEKVKTTWRKSWEYDNTSYFDTLRKTQGLMPYSLNSKYKEDNDLDKYLYNKGLPHSSEFKKLYNEILASTKEEEAYNKLHDDFKHDLFSEYSTVASANDGKIDDDTAATRFYNLLNNPKYEALRDKVKLPSQAEEFETYADEAHHNLTEALKKNNAKADNKTFSYKDLADEFSGIIEKYSLPYSAAGLMYELSDPKSYAKALENRDERIYTPLAQNMRKTDKDLDEAIKNYQASSINIEKATQENNAIGAINSYIDQLGSIKTMLRTNESLIDNYITEQDTAQAFTELKSELRNKYRGAGGFPVPESYYTPSDDDIQSRAKEIAKKRLDYEYDHYSKLQPYYNKVNEADFAEYSKKGLEFKNPDGMFEGAMFFGKLIGKIPNKATYVKGNYGNGGTVGELKKYAYLTNDEVAIYSYLLAKEGESSAEKFVDALKLEINQRSAQWETDRFQDLANNAPITASILSVGMTFLKPIGYVGSIIDRIAGNEIDPNAWYFSPNRTQSTIRGTVAENIQEDVGGKAGNVLSFLYNTGMSMGDSLVSMLTVGGGASILMGLGAASDTVQDVKSRGGSDAQALLVGTLAGVAEGFFEKFSLDSVLTLGKEGTKKTAKSFVLNMLKQGGIEASEEVATEIANSIADLAIMGDRSNYELAVQQYVSSGMSLKEAETQASKDIFNNILSAGIGGFISGVGFGAGAQAVSDINTSRFGNEIKAQGVAGDIISEGLNMAENTEAYKSADALNKVYQEKGDKGIKGYELGQQAYLNQETIASQERQSYVDDLGKIGLSTEDMQKGIQIYDQLSNISQSVKSGKRFQKNLTELRNNISNTIAKQQEADAELHVTSAKIQSRLMPLYDAMSDAAKSGDTALYRQAKNKYMAEYYIAEAETEEATLKNSNKKLSLSNATRAIIDDIILRTDSESAESVDTIANESGIENKEVGINGEQRQEANIPLQSDERRSLVYGGSTTSGTGYGGIPDNAKSTGIRSQEGIGSTGQSGFEAGGRELYEGSRTVKTIAKSKQEQQNGRQFVKKGKEWDANTNDAINHYISRVQSTEGRSPNVRAVTEVDERTASIMDRIRGITGRDAVYLFESDSDILHGFVNGEDIYIRYTGKVAFPFHLGHEIAHIDPLIHNKGMAVAEELTDTEINRYAEARKEHTKLSMVEGFDLRSELVSDMFGKLMCEVVYGRTLGGNMGLDEQTKNRFYDAFISALEANPVIDEDANGEIGSTIRSLMTTAADGSDTNQYSTMDFDDLMEVFFSEGSDGDGTDFVDNSGLNVEQFNEVLNNILNQITSVREGYVIDETSVYKIAKSILNETQSQYSLDKLIPELNQLFNMLETSDINWDVLIKSATDTMKKIINESHKLIDNPVGDDFRRFVRGMRIKLDDTQKSEVAYIYGSLKEYRQKMFGFGAYIVKDSSKGSYLDGNLWNDLSEYGYLNPDENSPNQPSALLEALEASLPVYENEYGFDNEQAAFELFLNTVDKYFDAARDAGKLNEKSELKKIIAEMKAEAKQRYRQKLDQIKKENAQKRKSDKKRLIDKKNQEIKNKLDKQKAYYRDKLAKEKAKRINQRYKVSAQTRMLNEASNLFSKGVTIEQYGRSEYYNHRIGLLLRNMWLKNGYDVGGYLSHKKLDDIWKNSDSFKDKSMLSYSRETFMRNLEDIASSKEEGRRLVNELYKPISRGVADMVRWERGWAERIAKLKLTTEESALVQLIGTGGITNEVLSTKILAENGSDIDSEKIENAIKVFREFYDEALKKANDTLVRNGYAPIKGRRSYFPNIPELNMPYQEFINTLKGDSYVLPAEISGLTDTFRPGKPWFKNFQKRVSDVTAYDAIRGFNNYLAGVAKVIFLTDGIQRIRQSEAFIRSKNSYNNPDMEHKSRLKGRERTEHLTNFVAYLKEYGNQLAGKKAGIDRAIENVLTRRLYATLDWIKKRFGANAVGGNFSTALSNFIPLTQGIATMDTVSFLKGMRSAISRQIKMDGLWTRSDFLISRFGKPDMILTRGWDITKQKAGKALNWMFEAVDRFTAETLVFGKYQEGIKKGLSEAEAMSVADEYAERTMAGRTIGSMPTLFNSKFLGIFTQFQLEVNNQMSNTFKDMPRWAGGDKRKLVRSFILLLFTSWLYNEISEKLLNGRRTAFDPVNVVVECVDDIISGEKAGDIFESTKNNILEQLPLGQLLVNGGRVPLASALDKIWLTDPIKATLNGDENADQKWEEFAETILYNFALPAGGGQLRKTLQGIDAYSKGGKYYSEQFKDGEYQSGRLAYPVDNGVDTFMRMVIFGSSSVAPDGYNWKDDILSEAKTTQYNQMIDAGVDKQKAYAFLSQYSGNDKKALKMLNLATFDSDKDGEPDFKPVELDLISRIINLPHKGDFLKATEREADSYMNDDETKEEELKKAAELWNRYIGMYD